MVQEPNALVVATTTTTTTTTTTKTTTTTTMSKNKTPIKKMTQPQKKYAAQRVREIAKETIVGIGRRGIPIQDKIDDLRVERRELWSDSTGVTPLPPRVLTELVAAKLAEVGPATAVSTCYAHIDLQDLIRNVHHKEIAKLDQRIGRLRLLKQRTRVEIADLVARVNTLATEAEDDILLGCDGLSALENFTKRMDKFLA